MKLKSGLSNGILSSNFNMSNMSKATVCSEDSNYGQMSAYWGICSTNIGFFHISSADIHVYSQSLFGGSETLSLLVVDGTYMFIKKTMNFIFQRKTYSLHKGRPLVKPMVIVSTSGYYITFLGTYIARTKMHLFKRYYENNKKMFWTGWKKTTCLLLIVGLGIPWRILKS